MKDDIIYYPDYEPDDLNDDDDLYRIKQAIDKLNSIQKKIFLTYAELGSYAATAREFGVSTPTAKTYITKIKEKIYDNI